MASRGIVLAAGESIPKLMFVLLGGLFVFVHFAEGQDDCNILSTSQLGQSPIEIIESVDETSPQGTLIDTLTFSSSSINDLTLEYINNDPGDDATLLNPTSTSIVNGNLQLVLSAAGAVKVQERDGPGGVQQFSLTLRCRVNSNRHVVFHPIRVSVSDINDNRPAFVPASPGPTSISELTAVGTTVLRASATDRDIGASGNVQFFVQNNPNDPLADDFFEIPLPAQGFITLKTAVNYEAADNTDHQYLLMITAEDQGTSQLTATQTFTINILDEDDLPPAFNPCIRASLSDPCNPVTYSGEVTSGVNSGAVSDVNPEPVNAFDQDRDLQQADQTAIKYSIADGSPSTYADKFQIDENTGVVSVRQTINRVDAASYLLKIRAYQEDNPFRLATADMMITVNPSGNERPAFDQANYVGYVFENAPSGTTVRDSSSAQTPLKVMLSDPDVLDGSPAVTIDVTTQPAGNDDRFSVTQGTSTREWYVLANGALDAETTNQYTLTITARETSGTNPQSSNPSVVTINVQDVNDNTPVFNGGTAGSSANPLTGAVSIPVADGTSVVLSPGTPQCSDTDTGSTFTYSIDRVINGADNLFSINQNTGDIRVASGAGLTDGTVYTVVIVCSDGLNERQGYVDITVTGTQNNRPIFPLQQYTTRLGEEAPVNGPVTMVTARDPDGNVLSYSLGTGNTDNDFQINQNTGEITVRNQLDYERTPSYTLQVLATDNGSPPTTATATVQVDLTNGNDNSPTFTAPANPNQPIEVAEGGQNGDPIQSVQATDPDGAGSAGITYSLLRGGDKFAINPTTGQITRRGPLDRDDQGEIPITVQAQDSGGRIGLLDLTIQLTDVNNKPPVFQDNEFARRPLSPPNAEYIVNVDENQPAMSIIDLEAADPDVGASVQYTRDSVTPTTGETLFTVNENTGVLSTTGPLDYESVTPARYTVVILAEDTAQAAPHLNTRLSTATVTVNIQDKNDFPPTFEGTPYSFTTREDAAIGMSVGQLSATDADNPQPQFIYSTYTDPAVQNSDAAAALFAVDPLTGDVVTRRNLASDYTNINQFPLLVRVSDEGPPVMSSTGIVNIEVTERGSANAVSFTQSQYTGTVPENAQAGTTVAFTRGIDISPSRSNVDYTIVSSETTPATSEDTTGYFRVVRPANLNDPLILEITRALDYENIQQYLLTLQVAPSGSSGTGRRKKRQLADNTALVQVNVQDVNDNAPMFDDGTYVTGVSEDANLFSSLVQVRASDRDSSPFNNFVYKIKTQPNGQLSPVARNFTVDSSTGVVRNLVPFRPGQVGKKFFFNVEADEAPAQSASGGQTFTGDTSVVVVVVNDANRAVMVGNLPPDVCYSCKDNIKRTFQDVSGNYVLIERVEAKQDGNTLDYANCDVYFYMIRNGTFDALTRAQAISVLEGSRTQVDQLWRTCDAVPRTDTGRASVVAYRGVQYTGSTSYSGISDLQAALIALGVLLFLLALLALLWLCCCTRIRKRTPGYQIPPPYEPPPAPEPIIYEPEKKEYETQEGIATFGHDMTEPPAEKEVVITGQYNKAYEHADESQVGTLSFPQAHDDVGPNRYSIVDQQTTQL